MGICSPPRGYQYLADARLWLLVMARDKGWHRERSSDESHVSGTDRGMVMGQEGQEAVVARCDNGPDIARKAPRGHSRPALGGCEGHQLERQREHDPGPQVHVRTLPVQIPGAYRGQFLLRPA